MWRMLLPYYLLFLISIILFLKTDIRLSRTELARLVMGTIFTPHAQRERGKVIDRGVHIYIYIYVCGRKKI